MTMSRTIASLLLLAASGAALAADRPGATRSSATASRRTPRRWSWATLYLYVGHDEAQRDEMFNMKEWLVYSTTDMKTWTPHGPIMNVKDFKWAKKDAWASQAIYKNGKYWFYAAVEHDNTHPGKAIAVAVSDKPTGPFVDAKGSALITNEMTPKGTHSWEDIDPTVMTDDDGTTWIAWGNRQCYIAKLKPNMIEIDGPITEITPPHFEEGPWLHKRASSIT